MYTLNDINFLVSYALEKKAPGIELPKNKLEQLLQQSQLLQFKRKLGIPEQYDPRNPQGFEVNKIITSDLEPFKVIMGDKTPMLKVDSQGYATLPKDFYYPSTLRIRQVKSGVESWRKVDVLSDKEFNDRISSALLHPSLRYPIANFQSGVVRFEPRNIKVAHFVYLRLPVKPVYAIKMTRGFAEYDSTKSTELQWNDINTLDIISILINELLQVQITMQEIQQIKQPSQ